MRVIGAAAPVGLPTYGQQPAVPVVGFLSSRPAEQSEAHFDAFRRSLRETGYVEGQNVVIEYRWANGRYERLPALARELVALRVTVMVAVGGVPSAQAAKAATATIPIVFLIGDDPMRVGLVASFNRPGGNLTGVSFLTSELGGKRLGLLCELVPNATTIALLLNPNNPAAASQRQDVQTAAHALGRRLLVVHASSETEFEPTFAMLTRDRVGALVVENDSFFDSQSDRLIALAARNAIPAIYHLREFPAAGGLMSYGCQPC
jgi:ABC-type uncharacterized transport system substrate-binding protein